MTAVSHGTNVGFIENRSTSSSMPRRRLGSLILSLAMVVDTGERSTIKYRRGTTVGSHSCSYLLIGTVS